MHMHVHHSTVYNSKDLGPTQMPISVLDWTKKMWYIYTMEYYAVIKNEFVSFVGTWMNLETIILSKLTEEQKMKHHLFSFIGRC